MDHRKIRRNRGAQYCMGPGAVQDRCVTSDDKRMNRIKKRLRAPQRSSAGVTTGLSRVG